MPDPEVVQSTPAEPEWSQESVEKQVEQAEPEAEVKEKVEEKVEKVVPIGALHEARARLREESQRAKSYEQQLAQLAQQQQQLLARLTQPQQRIPDPQTDPLGAVVHSTQQTQAEIQRIRQERDQERAVGYQQQQYQNFVGTVKAHEAAFAKAQPDYIEAVEFAKKARVSEYEAMGLSHQAALARLQQDEHDLANWALQNGESPAKAAYEWSKARGYVPSAKKLEMQKEGQGASTPSGGGGRGGGAPSVEALMKMSGSDFAKATEGPKWEQLMKKLGGG